MSRERSVPTINEVRLRNFKSSIQADVVLRPLTLVIGANSSGKSTLLQGMTALGQAVQLHGQRESFPLNGDLMDLGYFSQVRHLGADPTSSVSLGATIASQPSDFEWNRASRRASWQLDGKRRQRLSGPWNITYDIEFKGQDPEDPSSALIRQLSIRAVLPDESVLTIALKRVRKPKTRVSSGDVMTVAGRHRPLEMETVDSLRGSVEYEGRTTAIIAVGLRGPLPLVFISSVPEHELLVNRYFADLTAYHTSQIDYDVFGDEDLGDDGGEVLHSPAPTKRSMQDFVERSVALLRRIEQDGGVAALRGNTFSEDDEVPGSLLLLQERERLQKRIMQKLSRRERVPVVLDSPDIELASMAVTQIGRTLVSTRHLGGLRAAPQVLYPTSSRAQQGELGRDGEYSAAVLYAWRNRYVNAFLPDRETEPMPLARAVEEWATHLGLFDSIEAHHQAALGIDLKVRQPGVEDEIDITAVGLGVSQLLPVLLRCLLSPPGSLVLLEQPELHLHPASQQRLAEFLLACARSGRQLVVETHSEHIVNRLRLRAAKDPDDDIASTVGLVFAARDRSSGETAYQSVSLNPYGGLSEWPEGFMDEGVRDARELLDAGMSKLVSDSQPEPSQG